MHGFNPRVGKISWSRKCQLVPVFLPGKTWTQPSGHTHMHACACARARTHIHTHTHTHTHVFGTPVRGSIGLSMATENVMMNKS